MLQRSKRISKGTAILLVAVMLVAMLPISAKADEWIYKDPDHFMVPIDVLVEPSLSFDTFSKGEFHNGVSRLYNSSERKYGAMNKYGKTIIPVEYDRIDEYKDGLTIAKKGDDHWLMDTNGQVVRKLDYLSVDSFSEGLCLVKIAIGAKRHENGVDGSDIYWGYIDTTGEVVIELEPVFEYGWKVKFGRFSDGVAIVTSELSGSQKYYAIDKNGKVIFSGDNESYKFSDAKFSDGMAVVYNSTSGNLKYGAIDKTGKIVVPIEYDKMQAFSGGYAIVEKDGKYGFVDKSGKLAIPCIYDYVHSPFIDGRAVVQKGSYMGKKGVIDGSGNIIVPIEYSYVAYNSETKLIIAVSYDDEFLVYDYNGNEVNNELYNYVHQLTYDFAEDDVAWAQRDGLFGIVQRAVAKPTSSSVLVDGKEIAFDAYNIGGNNYFKLRDLAYVLNGTEKQFDVGFDESKNVIIITKDKEYVTVGGELQGKGTGDQNLLLTTSRITLNGYREYITSYNIGGNNYFKLRDVGSRLGFSVEWDGENNRIVIDTSKGYKSEGAEDPVKANYVKDTATFVIPGTDDVEVTLSNYADVCLYSPTTADFTGFCALYIGRGGSVSFNRDIELSYPNPDDLAVYHEKIANGDFIDPVTLEVDYDKQNEYNTEHVRTMTVAKAAGETFELNYGVPNYGVKFNGKDNSPIFWLVSSDDFSYNPSVIGSGLAYVADFAK